MNVKIEINLNARCRVVLTAKGAQAENRRREKVNGHLHPSQTMMDLEAGDEIVAPLWRLFHTFGSDIFHGADPVFVDNCICLDQP